jgi:uncharacterized protein (UPF0332 family)
MPVSQTLIDKSEENWESCEQLISTRRHNAAANRLYFSIFHLVYAEMVCNATKEGFSDKDKLGHDSKGKHELSIRYLAKRNERIGKNYRKLCALRVKADYSFELSVTKDELAECCKYWQSIRRELVENLASGAERMIL